MEFVSLRQSIAFTETEGKAGGRGLRENKNKKAHVKVTSQC
jgi:hypothetical protein